MTGPTSETPAVLHGLRCGNPHHPNSGQVYGIRPDFGHLVSLTEDGCSELVVSRDGGVTWAAVPVPTLAEAKAKLEGRAWKREAERLRAQLEQARAELQRAQPVLEAGRAWWASGENAPEDPTVDALFAAVDTYLSASGGMDGMPEPCQPIGCDNGHHLPGCAYAAVDAREAGQP